jgi:hypothetical protein
MSTTCSFLALYHGRTPRDAVVISVSADPELIKTTASQMLSDMDRASENPHDEVIGAFGDGRKRALELIIQGAATER